MLPVCCRLFRYGHKMCYEALFAGNNLLELLHRESSFFLLFCSIIDIDIVMVDCGVCGAKVLKSLTVSIVI